MGGRKRVSGGAVATRTAVIGWTCVLAGMPLGPLTMTANETLPHWHWQAEDLQQSCLSLSLVLGLPAPACSGQAPSAEALMAWWCAVSACEAGAPNDCCCRPKPSWNARRAKRSSWVKDGVRTGRSVLNLAPDVLYVHFN